MGTLSAVLLSASLPPAVAGRSQARITPFPAPG